MAAFAGWAAVLVGAMSSAFVALALAVSTVLPTGGVLAFISARDGNYDLYLIEVERGLTANFTRQSEWDYQSPAWSPDGQQIAFMSHRQDNFDVYVLEWRCGSVFQRCERGERRMTHNPAFDGTPAWSPDGKQIAFASERQGNLEIYVMDSACSVEDCDSQRLTAFRGVDQFPAWSPDGQLIAFASNRERGMEVYVMDRDGAYPQAVSVHSADDLFPAWSPDGERIAFVSDRDGNPEIYVMDDDGRSQRRLTHHRAHDYFPDWSPDGRWLAFVSERDGNEELYVMDMNCLRLAEECEAHVRRLTWNTAPDRLPVWRP